mgnify:CR=1 FL=1
MNKDFNALAWLLQRITAVGLVLLLGIHFWLLHFKTHGEVIKFSDVSMRLHTWTLVLIDICLLIFGLYHASNGIYSIVQDYSVGGNGRRVTLWVLMCGGCVLAIIGGISLFRFLYVAG